MDICGQAGPGSDDPTSTRQREALKSAKSVWSGFHGKQDRHIISESVHVPSHWPHHGLSHFSFHAKPAGEQGAAPRVYAGGAGHRSEERRVGEECRSGCAQTDYNRYRQVQLTRGSNTDTPSAETSP